MMAAASSLWISTRVDTLKRDAGFFWDPAWHLALETGRLSMAGRYGPFLLPAGEKKQAAPA
ncbi:hypothetical protein AGR4B_Cc61299 [Agrobacterium tumefaciens str. CFBP 5621]|nr:hypothetical protein AGR4B_Cc61299 [Agrobacterium tumefaciens str. CFBP 5621]